MSNGSSLLLVLLLGGAAAAGYAYQRGQARQERRLARFTILDADLTAHNERARQAAAATIRGISKTVYLNHNWGPDLQVLYVSEQLWNRTESLTDTLKVLRHQLSKLSGSETSKAQVPATPAVGATFTAHLTRYLQYIRRLAPGADLSAGGPRGSWPAQTASPPVAMATLTALESQVREYSRLALQAQAEKEGSKCFICGRIEAGALTTSATVAPGADYQAQLFLAETPVADLGTLSMAANHKPLPVGRANVGEVTLPTPPPLPDQPDTVRASWHGTIRAHSYPADTAWELTVPYLLAKPTAP